jgi:hypothetical protein
LAIKYLDAKRIRGTAAERVAMGEATPTWEADFDMSNPYSNGWARATTDRIGVDTANNDISFNADAHNQTNDSMVYDLQHADALNGSNAHATNWVLRFKIIIDNFVRVDAGGNELLIGLCDGDEDTVHSAVQDFMGLQWWNSTASGDQLVKVAWANNENSATNNDTISGLGAGTTSSGDYWYVEIIRLSDTSYTVRLTTNSNYTGTTGGGFNTQTVDTTGVTSLRYFMIHNYMGNNGNDIIGRITELKFYNAVTTAAKTINLPDGTIFEETDTYKYYFLQSGAWVAEA